MATTMVKKPSTKKAKAPLGHPPYVEMIKTALLALKERTGSSHYAIAKHIEEQQKVTLPSNFKKLLSVQLKKLVASGRLVKVKNSFKLPSAAAATTVSKPKLKTSKAVVGVKAAEATKSTPVKPKAKAVAAKPRSTAAPKAKKKAAAATKPVRTAKNAVPKSPAKKVAAGKRKAMEKPKKPKTIKFSGKKVPAAKKAKK